MVFTLMVKNVLIVERRMNGKPLTKERSRDYSKKYEIRGDIVKTLDISGFGGGYEAGCQKMLLQGLRFLKNHPDFDWSAYKEFRGVFGVTMAESSEAKELDDAICQGMDSTGAMHSAVINHLAYIHKHGYEKWITGCKKQGATIYERASEDELDKTILVGQIEWQIKLDGGYDPMAKLFKTISKEDIIEVDPKDPESIKKAAEEIARRMKDAIS